MDNSPSKIFLNIAFVREKSPKWSGSFCCHRHINVLQFLSDHMHASNVNGSK